MPKQFTSDVYGMPFKKNPRDGQDKVFKKIISDESLRNLNVQLPTGYGKSFVSAGVYSILKKQNRVNRLLIIVPTSAQNDQYVNDGHADFKDACVDGPLTVCDVPFSGVQAIKHHRNNTRQIFIITVQSLTRGSGSLITEMMSSGNWMVTVDEYHHYGIEKTWGLHATQLPYSFLLAMSATPYRTFDDSAFGKPDMVVSYREAVKSECLKPLKGHSYIYKIDAVLPDGDIISYTTDELVREVGSCIPGDIEKHKIERKMRWSPKYVSPLISHPIERMHNDKIKTGYKLQAIVGAMCVSHAAMVCDQIRTMYPELSVDWVGTGNDGRKPEENKRIIESFCPKKDVDGRRNPTLDILVHVGMAGEGLDSVNVSEIIHLNKASMNNSNNQENGRAARYLKGVTGNINFDSCSEYASGGYVGAAIMDAMDNLPPSIDDEDGEKRSESDYEPLPDEPTIQIWNMELENIDSGDPEVQRMAKVIAQNIAPKEYGIHGLEKDILNPDSKFYQLILPAYRNMREIEARQYNEKSEILQWKEQVNSATSKVTGLVIKVHIGADKRFDKTLVGDIKRRINTRKKFAVGEISNDIQILKNHFKWLKQLETSILDTKEVPAWLQ